MNANTNQIPSIQKGTEPFFNELLGIDFNNNNRVSILDENSDNGNSFLSASIEPFENNQEILQNELSEYLAFNNGPFDKNNNNDPNNGNHDENNELQVIPQYNFSAKLYFCNVKSKEWVFPSQRIRKDSSSPEIRYETNPPTTIDLYILIDLFDISPRLNAEPRRSVHKLQRSVREDKDTFKPILARMETQGNGCYQFVMPDFKLIRTKENIQKQRNIWRAKYKTFHDIVGFDELTPTKSLEQVENLISSHLREHKSAYEYVCLGAFVCVQQSDNNGMERFRMIDGPYFSSKLASL